jgi:hypothetical protein
MKAWMIPAAALLALACAAPATWVGVPAGTVDLPGNLEVRADAAWSRRPPSGKGPGFELWTTDGVPLDQLRFYAGIAPGQPLAAPARAVGKQVPTFQEGLEAHEIVELYEALATRDGSVLTRDKLAPAPFAGGPGFRFEFTLIRKRDELTLRGLGFGAVRDGRLYLMVYTAPRMHYFPKNLARVEAIAGSARIKG